LVVSECESGVRGVAARREWRPSGKAKSPST